MVSAPIFLYFRNNVPAIFFSIPKKKGWYNNLAALDEMFKRIPGTYAVIL